MPRTERKITREELVKMLGAEDRLELCAQTAYCGRDGCRSSTEIVDYGENIFINDLGDSILCGKCKHCGEAVVRYIETGEG